MCVFSIETPRKEGERGMKMASGFAVRHAPQPAAGL